MGCNSGFDEAHMKVIDRSHELWRLKRRFEKYNIRMSSFTLKESLILHRALKSDCVCSREINDNDMVVLLVAEKRIFGDNGHGDGEDSA